MSFIRRFASSPSVWYFSLVPINMAIGSIKVVITLAALSLGATLVDIGIIIAANASATIVMSIVWGRLSDYFGLRVRFLLVFFLACAPMFVLLGLGRVCVAAYFTLHHIGNFHRRHPTHSRHVRRRIP